jgi:hypothetical protein
VISLNLVLAGLRLGLKNRQVGEKWVSDDCSYLCKGLTVLILRHLEPFNAEDEGAKSTVVGQTTAVVSYGGAP